MVMVVTVGWSKSILLILQVYSFDLGDHPYARPAALWLSNQFPGMLGVEVCYSIIFHDFSIVFPMALLCFTGLVPCRRAQAFGYDMGRLLGNSSRLSSSESTCEAITSDMICRSHQATVWFQLGYLKDWNESFSFLLIVIFRVLNLGLLTCL